MSVAGAGVQYLRALKMRLLTPAEGGDLSQWHDRLTQADPEIVAWALLALAELLTERPTSESTCESVEPPSATLLAPSGQCPSCDRRRVLLNAAKKRHREERRGG